MGLRIQTNVDSLRAQTNMAKTVGRIEGHFARLASGLRIQTASDDASGLGVSERLRAATRSISVATRNIEDGISMVRTAEGLLGEVSTMLLRAKELAMRGMTGTLTQDDLVTLDAEYLQIVDAVQRVHHDSEYNGISLFDQVTTVDIHVGNDTGQTIGIELPNLAFFGDVMGTASISDPGTGPQAVNFIVDALIPLVAGVRGVFGATENRLQSSLRSARVTRDNLAAFESRIRDVDVASETALLARESILQQAGVAVLGQANIAPQLAMTLL